MILRNLLYLRSLDVLEGERAKTDVAPSKQTNKQTKLIMNPPVEPL